MPKKSYRKNRKHRNKKGGMDNTKKTQKTHFQKLMEQHNIPRNEGDWYTHARIKDPRIKDPSDRLPTGRTNSTVPSGDLNHPRSKRDEIHLKAIREKLVNELKELNRKTRKSR